MVSFPESVLPYGVFSRGSGRPRLGVGIEHDIIDLGAAAGRLSRRVDPSLLTAGSLDPLLAAGRPAWENLRSVLVDAVGSGELDAYRLPQAEVSMHLAWSVGDYVDFYSSIDHATNVGRIFRPDAEPLTPNWRHMPIAYHGRSGTVQVDGTPVRRPSGQRREPGGDVVFGPSQRLDLEAEMGWVLGGESPPGEPVDSESAADHVFGLVLLNDWSARDLQAWEYVPLGPFLGKSFATSVSAWVVPLEALQSARRQAAVQDPTPLPYLRTSTAWAFDIDLEVWLQPSGGEPQRLAAVNPADHLYWSVAQQLTHMTVNGAPVRPGDLIGTGTISGPQGTQRGCLLELSWNGRDPIELGGEITRTYLEDGDTVTLTASFPTAEGRSPLGPVSGQVVGS